MSSSVLILYGSQTGNAEDTARLIEREAQRRHYSVRCLPADAYTIPTLPTETAIVLVVSTTGQGDAPANIVNFWKFLRRKSLPANSLSNASVAVFGLGDSGYPKYNIMAKLIYRRLLTLGAHTLCPLGLGDDQHPTGHEAALDTWLPQLWKGLRTIYTPPQGVVLPPDDDISPDLPAACCYTIVTTVAAPLVNQQQVADDGGGCMWEVSHAEAIAAAGVVQSLDAAAIGIPSNSSTSTTTVSNANTNNIKAAAATKTYSETQPWMSTLLQNTRITSSTHFQDVRLIELNLQRSQLSFEPGDVLAMWPQQRPEAVVSFCHRLGVSPDAYVFIKLTNPPYTTSTSTTTTTTDNQKQQQQQQQGVVVRLGALVAGTMDIDGASPRRTFFQMLGRFATHPREIERLQYFASPAGRDDLHDYNRREGRTVLEILNDFPSAMPPLEWILQYGPRLQPRRFSIASSLAYKPDVAQLLVAILDWVTPSKRRRRGVCTRWLGGLAPTTSSMPADKTTATTTIAASTDIDTKATAVEVSKEHQQVRMYTSPVVPVWIEKGALRLPRTSNTPIIMVGPGTGVAPFRSFIQERLATIQLEYTSNNTSNGGVDSDMAPCVLLFGCRSESADYYCREDWEAAVNANILAGPNNGLLVAFSRDQEKKVYVTHKIREYGRELWALMQAGAAVYVAGSADKMPADVLSAFRDIAVEFGGLSGEEADALLRKMESERRYQTEAWS